MVEIIIYYNFDHSFVLHVQDLLLIFIFCGSFHVYTYECKEEI